MFSIAVKNIKQLLLMYEALDSSFPPFGSGLSVGNISPLHDGGWIVGRIAACTCQQHS